MGSAASLWTPEEAAANSTAQEVQASALEWVACNLYHDIPIRSGRRGADTVDRTHTHQLGSPGPRPLHSGRFPPW
eukprot:CAMPEP_0173374008 /NCGR_PEP_ID=MMETSP1144-20121109/28826_1 /TAXON_ID=483371 /ORGANISM="non described non described, Strain CCMP2298" /LENGTH=74 /DNA_ID=CAMNT_0014326269 /DNA_START=459 /DNA_END=680 /DNA_ORIENTATION=+